MGSISLANIATAAAVCGSLATPVIWGGQVNAVNDVQNEKIINVQKQADKTDQSIVGMNKKIDALLWKSGINPNDLK